MRQMDLGKYCDMSVLQSKIRLEKFDGTETEPVNFSQNPKWYQVFYCTLRNSCKFENNNV
ncbi:MAG: hypothetical protein HC785_08005 [Calothrix sp. CSU_2_0]|nr:hypothetical protein [Calothrix sp. CSU_2_0]